MYLHEFQTKALFSEYGITVLPHTVVRSLEELRALDLKEAILKIQVHAGGRGKAGGIVHAKSPNEIIEGAKRLFGMRLVNAQTGPEGICVDTLLVDTPARFSHEYYLAVILDRKEACARVIASKEGGVDIEETAKSAPDKIITEKVGDSKKLHHFQYMRLVAFLGLQQHQKEAIQTIQGLVEAFFDLEALLLEINPLVLTEDHRLVALDAKAQIDDNCLFRHKRLSEMRDLSQLSQAEREAMKHDLQYVALPGTIGCMVNGAGLAMATMDLIHYWGGEPANFLDVGGSATIEKVREGFLILFQDPSISAILVNIFGGIMDCRIIAEALLLALSTVTCSVPIVVRMEGTHVDAARKMLSDSRAAIYTATSLNDAAKYVVEASRGHIRQ